MRSNQKRQAHVDDRGESHRDRGIPADGPANTTEPFGLDQPVENQDGKTTGMVQAGILDEIGFLEVTDEEVGEDDLIKRSLAGDQDAFEVLVRRYSPRVFNIIGSFFRRRDMIEDIAQEVFARSYFSLASFTLGRSFEAWVAKIAVNACYDHLRAQRRRAEHQVSPGADQEDDWLEFQMIEAARDRHSSEERQREAADIAERLLSKLEPEDRMVLVLMDRDGFSVKEVSDLTGWGQSKIKVRAFRARRTLRAAMKRLLMGAERKQRSGK